MVGDRSTKLLVLDDEEELCELLVDLLNASNFQAVGVCSLDEATKILSDQDFDFFISDFYLGDKTPVDLIQRIRAGELGKNKNCNIFVCTGEPLSLIHI